tara:strand:+ start:1318 stop:1575 length:258 start_codon:yes stop_codon:yes gene_type:complete
MLKLKKALYSNSPHKLGSVADDTYRDSIDRALEHAEVVMTDREFTASSRQIDEQAYHAGFDFGLLTGIAATATISLIVLVIVTII